MRVEMPKPPPPAPTASAIGTCPTVIKFAGRPGTGSLPSTIAPPDHPKKEEMRNNAVLPMQIGAVIILNFTHSRCPFSCFKTMNAMTIHCEKNSMHVLYL